VDRAVIDTNVIISSLFGGPPREVINLWRDGRLLLCLSDEIAAEYLEVLARFGEVKEEAQELVAMLSERENVLFVAPRERLRKIAADPEDNKFLECALAARAQTIISGDRHLVSLGRFRGIPILTPAAFLASLAGEAEG
jgi:hypothetical protein